MYKDSEDVEVDWIVGPIPIDDKVGKEIVVVYNTSIDSGDVFWTDANGRQLLKRTKNYRPTWKLNVTEPVSGNYYPVNSRIAIADTKSQVP